jgi:hypothetical protein
MRMFNKRVINKGSNNNMYSNQENSITREHKRNMNILEGVLIIVDIKHIKHHMRKLNTYHNHITFGMFSNLSIVKVYNLKEIQLQVLYNSLFYNGFIK